MSLARRIPFIPSMLIALALLMSMGAPAMAAEEPRYAVELKDGPLEVRAYPALIAAEVAVGGDKGEAGGAGFRMLAGYIFGGNAKKQSIAMTAPVIQSGRRGAWVVRFLMPGGYSLDALPAPNDPKVRLEPLPPTRIAVARFSGLAGDADIRRETQALEAFIKAKGLKAGGAASLARYDPPWTPWFMRRNEIWIPLAS